MVYANSLKKIIEKGTSNITQRIPTELETENALRENNLISCQSQVFPPIVFNVSICGSFIKKNYDRILENLRLSWQSEATNGGLGNSNRVNILYINQTELIPDKL